MSKKMKRDAFESSSHVSYEDPRARFKHQTLLQDFMELQQETEAQKNTLMAFKRKKLRLQAEVWFLRQRYQFLVNNKSSTPKDQFLAKQQPTQFRKSKKEKVNIKKPVTLGNFEKKKGPQTTLSPEFDLNLENASHVKQQSVQRAIANQRVRINGPKISLIQESGQTQKPVIDLNQIFREEEELHEQFEPFDHPTIRNGIDEGLGSRGKRKISWQDPVAISVWSS